MSTTLALTPVVCTSPPSVVPDTDCFIVAAAAAAVKTESETGGDGEGEGEGDGEKEKAFSKDQVGSDALARELAAMLNLFRSRVEEGDFKRAAAVIPPSFKDIVDDYCVRSVDTFVFMATELAEQCEKGSRVPVWALHDEEEDDSFPECGPEIGHYLTVNKKARREFHGGVLGLPSCLWGHIASMLLPAFHVNQSKDLSGVSSTARICVQANRGVRRMYGPDDARLWGSVANLGGDETWFRYPLLYSGPDETDRPFRVYRFA